MKTVLGVGLVLIGVWIVFYSVWWHVLRPAVLVRLRYAVFAARDKLRCLVIDGKLPEHSDAGKILEHACRCVLVVMPALNVADVLFVEPGTESRLRAERELKVLESANPELRAIYHEIREAGFGAMLINSPGFLPLYGLAALWAAGAFWFARCRAALERHQVRTWACISGTSEAAHPGIRRSVA